MKETVKHIVIAGGTGLVGSRLAQMLRNQGYKVSILSRTSPNADGDVINWKPSAYEIDQRALEGSYAVINLAGAGVMDQAWTPAYKKIILDSRINTNITLANAMEKMPQKPIYISASAVGYYGGRQSSIHFTESDKPASSNFLQDVTEQWESAALDAGKKARRHISLRIGIVLSNRGGALVEMLKGFKFGIGSYFAPGDQIYSWIHLDDLCRIILHVLGDQSTSGVYNAVAPTPVSAKKLAESIAIIKFGRARLIPVPEFAMKLALGERRQTLTDSIYASSNKIEKTGFKFEYENLDDALRELF